MFKKEVTYQLKDLVHAVIISEDGMKVYRKGISVIEFDEEAMDKIVEEYEEISRS